MKANWYLDERIRYYMQMVIPNIFSIDIWVGVHLHMAYTKEQNSTHVF